MSVCRVCHFAAELDDVAVACDQGRCICLRCFVRVTDTYRPLGRNLQRALTGALAAADRG